MSCAGSVTTGRTPAVVRPTAGASVPSIVGYCVPIVSTSACVLLPVTLEVALLNVGFAVHALRACHVNYKALMALPRVAGRIG